MAAAGTGELRRPSPASSPSASAASSPRRRIESRLKLIEPSSRPPRADRAADARRYFCSGCPHNTSTQVPEGSRRAGIGCHYMVMWMDRQHLDLHPHGRRRRGHGSARRRSPNEKHVFANLGDGTYFHSGIAGDPPGRSPPKCRSPTRFSTTTRGDDRRPAGGRQPERAADHPQLEAEGVGKIVIVTTNRRNTRDHGTCAQGVPIRIATN